jgi:hypothetical protein
MDVATLDAQYPRYNCYLHNSTIVSVWHLGPEGQWLCEFCHPRAKNFGTGWPSGQPLIPIAKVLNVRAEIAKSPEKVIEEAQNAKHA